MNGRAKHVGLWVVQGLVALVYAFVGATKALTPVGQLPASMASTAQLTPLFVHALGVAELLGAVGLVLPLLTGILPSLTVAAAISLAVLQLCAMAFHIGHAEYAVLPVNLILFALAAVIAWGRRRP